METAATTRKARLLAGRRLEFKLPAIMIMQRYNVITSVHSHYINTTIIIIYHYHHYDYPYYRRYHYNHNIQAMRRGRARRRIAGCYAMEVIVEVARVKLGHSRPWHTQYEHLKHEHGCNTACRCVCICIRIGIRTCICIRISIRICTCTCTCIYVCTCMCYSTDYSQQASCLLQTGQLSILLPQLAG